MTQAERDRLVALKKAKKKLITQKQAAEELGITERHVRRLLRELKRRGDKVVAHGLRGLPSNRKLSADTEREAVSILSQPVYATGASMLTCSTSSPYSERLHLLQLFGDQFSKHRVAWAKQRHAHMAVMETGVSHLADFQIIHVQSDEFSAALDAKRVPLLNLGRLLMHFRYTGPWEQVKIGR
jgi:biotin operon repressor